MKSIKEFFEIFGELIIYLLIVILVIVIGFGSAYMISVSNLPDWFKFFC